MYIFSFTTLPKQLIKYYSMRKLLHLTHCSCSAFDVRCGPLFRSQFRCILSGALRFYYLYVVYWWLTVSPTVCVLCVCVCACDRCAECESAWHYCLYCESCCNFVKISTLLVCPPARWSLSSVQQCHICVSQCPGNPVPSRTLSNAADLSAVSAITAGLFFLS